MLGLFRRNNNKQTYPSNKIVYVLWLFPDGFLKAGQLYGIFSSELKALTAIENNIEFFDKMPHKIESHITDHRLIQPRTRYWRPT